MTLQELIYQLQELQAEAGDRDVEVRMAQQPRWAFEYSISDVVLVGAPDRVVTRAEFDAMSEDEQERVMAQADEEDGTVVLLDEGETLPEPVVYLGEGSQLGYLPGGASRALGWR